MQLRPAMSGRLPQRQHLAGCSLVLAHANRIVGRSPRLQLLVDVSRLNPVSECSPYMVSLAQGPLQGPQTHVETSACLAGPGGRRAETKVTPVKTGKRVKVL